MRIFDRFLLLFAVAVLCATAPSFAQDKLYDGLTVMGQGHMFTDSRGTHLQLLAFQTKYKENVVGMYFLQGTTRIHFYMNAVTWARMEKLLTQGRDQWATLQPGTFEHVGSVKGYVIATRQSSLRFNLVGSNDLQSRELQIVATGGASVPKRITMHLHRQQLVDLVSDFAQIDGFLHGGAPLR